MGNSDEIALLFVLVCLVDKMCPIPHTFLEKLRCTDHTYL